MHTLTPYEQTGLPVYDIDLEAPPVERWREVCAAEGDRIHALIADFVEMVEDSTAGLPLVVRKLLPFMRKSAGAAGSVIASLYGEDYVKEIKGIAKYAQLPVGDVFIGNLCYDLTQAEPYLRKFRIGCSSYSMSINGAPMMVRNMD